MRKYILTIIALFFCLLINAQMPNNTWRNKDTRKPFTPELYMKRLNEFVTREAKLTQEESEKFFPILMEMFGKQFALENQQREALLKARRNPNMNEDEYEKVITKVLNTEVEMKKIEQSYYKKFHSVLSWKKVFAVRTALNKFRVEALNQFQPNRGNNKPQVPNWNNRPKMPNGNNNGFPFFNGNNNNKKQP